METPHRTCHYHIGLLLHYIMNIYDKDSISLFGASMNIIHCTPILCIIHDKIPIGHTDLIKPINELPSDYG